MESGWVGRKGGVTGWREGGGRRLREWEDAGRVGGWLGVREGGWVGGGGGGGGSPRKPRKLSDREIARLRAGARVRTIARA